MSITSHAFRFALAAAALCTSSAAADARPRRLVILDFDGPRTLADSGRNEVVALLGEQYDVVAKKRWEDARARAQQKSAGPTTWQKAAKTSGVDAIIEGWVQDEGRHKVLTVAVREAATGQEIDSVSVRLNGQGLSEKGRDKLSTELEGVLDFIEGGPEPVASQLKVIETRRMIGAKAPKLDTAARTTDDDDADEDADEAERPKRGKKKRISEATADAETAEAGEAGEAADPDDRDGDTKTKKDKEVAAAEPSIETKENEDLVSLFGATSDEGKTADPTAAHVPVPTPRFRIGGGAYYGSRSLTFQAENQTGPTSYAGVPSKGLEVNAELYPFPRKAQDGDLSGIGFSVNVKKSAGSEVSFDDGEFVNEYTINQMSYEAGLHYRHALASLVSIDGQATYGKSSYLITDAPVEFEVPDVEYSYFGAGAHLDLNIASRATVGFGARYMYMLDVGDISSVDWYGPGRASGLGLDASFVIPLPQRLYVRGALAYDKFSITYDGAGQITEDEGVSESSDSTVNGSLNVGITF